MLQINNLALFGLFFVINRNDLIPKKEKIA